MTLLDEGIWAIVPVNTTLSHLRNQRVGTTSRTMRVGKVVGWYPKQIRVSRSTTRTAEIGRSYGWRSHAVAIVENPLYSVMNEPNSTLQAPAAEAQSSRFSWMSRTPRASLTSSSSCRTPSSPNRSGNRQISDAKDIEFQLTG
jgi:hypothetical protein